MAQLFWGLVPQVMAQPTRPLSTAMSFLDGFPYTSWLLLAAQFMKLELGSSFGLGTHSGNACVAPATQDALTFLGRAGREDQSFSIRHMVE